jgi:NRPS condensation-like uncharacterized protein
VSKALDKSYPLWEVYICEEYEDGKSAILWNMHHALFDGMSAVLTSSFAFDNFESDVY